MVCVISAAHCGILSGTQVITQLPSAVTTSQRIGGSFAYNTVESAAPVAVTYAQPLYTQSIFGSPFFNPIISSPFYPGIVGQAPVVGQAPIFGQLPGQGQGPIQVPIASPPQGIPQGPAPPPPGAVVDDDTVSVDSA